MNFDDASPKDLERLLGLALRRKAQLQAEYNAAWDSYLTASGGNSTVELKQELFQKAISIKAQLDKTLSCISTLEARLGGYVTVTPFVDKLQQTDVAVKAPATVSVAESSPRFQKNAGKILNLLKVQVKPSTECVEPNDAIIKALFGTSGKKISITEKHKTKRKPAVVSNLNVQGTAVTDTPLSEYDRAVFGVLVSEIDVGNRYTTVNIIHRALIGRPGQGLKGFYPEKDQKNAIINSVSKLMVPVVDFSDVKDSLKKLKYTDKDGNELILRKDNILSASIFDAKVNGQPVEGVIFFKENSPLFDIANLKDQVIRYPHELLNVPNQNNIPLIISLKKYVMRRICEIKLHSKQLKPTITFDDVFSKCKVNADDKKSVNAPETSSLNFLIISKLRTLSPIFRLKKTAKSSPKFLLPSALKKRSIRACW